MATTLRPAATVPKPIIAFLSSFYTVSDTPTAHELYADHFLPSGEIVMAADRRKGREEIVALRHKMWQAVAARKHSPRAVYPFDNAASELMLHGEVDYDLKDGTSKHAVQWAGRMVFDAQSLKAGEPKLAFYQVWLTPK